MIALALIACVPVTWVVFWGVVFVLSDPLTWLLYAAGEFAEDRGWA